MFTEAVKNAAQRYDPKAGTGAPISRMRCTGAPCSTGTLFGPASGWDYNVGVDFDRLPGGALVRQGLEDLARGLESDASLLVLVGAPRLRRLGIDIPPAVDSTVEHRLYERLARVEPGAAHSRYNALIRMLVSFERAAECVG